MTIKQSRNVLHLSITERTALRVVLYVAQDKIAWYNDNGLHKIVLQELYPVILNNLIHDQGLSMVKRQKAGEENQVIHLDGLRILYRFTIKRTQQSLIKTEKEFIFTEKEDEKPTMNTIYKGLSIYPFQLLVSVDDELVDSNRTLDSYFTSL